MPIPSPACLVSTNPTPVDVTASATISGALTNATGVVFWGITCIGTDELNTPAAINATLTVNQGAKTFQFTAPSQLGSKVIFQSTVGQTGSVQGRGVDINGNPQAAYTTTFAVNVKTAGGLRVLAENETFEQDAVYGWVNEIDKGIRAATGGGATSVTGTGFWHNVSGSLQSAALIGTAGQFAVTAAGATDVAFASLSGDVTASTGTPGAVTVTGIQGNAFKSGTLGPGQDGYVVTWVNASNQLQMVAAGGGGFASWGGDLASSTSSAQWVGKLSGVGNGGGAIVLENGAYISQAGAGAALILQMGGASFLTSDSGNNISMLSNASLIIGSGGSAGIQFKNSSTSVAQFDGGSPGLLRWYGAVQAQIQHDSQSASVQGVDFIFTPQTSTHTTNQGGGNFRANLQVPTGSGVEAAIVVNRGVNIAARLGPAPDTGTGGTGASTSTLHLNPSIAPTVDNYAVAGTNTYTDIQGPSGGLIGFGIGGADYVQLTATSFTMANVLVGGFSAALPFGFATTTITSPTTGTLTLSSGQGAFIVIAINVSLTGDLTIAIPNKKCFYLFDFENITMSGHKVFFSCGGSGSKPAAGFTSFPDTQQTVLVVGNPFGSDTISLLN